MIWHSEPLDKILRELDTDPATGLSEEQASLRRTALRKQRSSKKGRRFFLQRCRVRLHNPFLLLLFIALVVYLAFSIIQTIQGGDAELSSAVRLTLSLMAVNLLILVGGAGMDARAAAYLAGRRDISSGVRVIRDGVERTISSEEMAPGDILLLKAGDLIPADCRLLDGTSLLCDESPLTRDEQPVEKNSEAVPEAITPLNKRENMLYAGCLLLRGECRAVAVETGEDTERSRLASLNSQGDAVPFKEHLKKWDRIGRFLILAAGILLLAIGLLFSATLPELLFTILSAAAALSSAGLPFLSLVFLSRGIRRMERDGVILRRLAAVSDLNRVNLLATDKSGILTEDRLSVIRLFAGNQLIKADRNRRLPEAALALLRLSLLCSGGQPNAARRCPSWPVENETVFPERSWSRSTSTGRAPFEAHTSAWLQSILSTAALWSSSRGHRRRCFPYVRPATPGPPCLPPRKWSSRDFKSWQWAIGSWKKPPPT